MSRTNHLPKITIPIKEIIALKCGDCCGFDWVNVVECIAFDCPLHSLRPKGRKDNLKSVFWDEKKLCMKARPIAKKITRVLSEEQKLAAGERFRKMHKEKKKVQETK